MPDSVMFPFHDWLVELRRELHQIPELAYQEKKTAAKICQVLDQLAIPYQSEVGKTGVVARLKADKEGPLVAYRADMDALPLDEANDVAYKSRHQGLMHACGHDGHVTVALGIIRWLKERQWPRNGSGEILFFFQPAEEGGAGAKAMLDTGMFDHEPVEAIFAGHMNPELPVGAVELIYGTAHAATNEIRIRIKGKGGHGAAPHLCIDPIVAGAHLVTQLQTFVSRTLAPLDSAVLTIGEFHAGTAVNIIPEEAHLSGTLRTLTPEVRAQAVGRIEEIVKSLDQAFGVSATLENIEGYPAHINDSDKVDHMKACVEQVLGADAALISRPRMGAEDFSYFCQKWPGAMVGLGCHDPARGFRFALHSPHFNMDERVLDVGVQLMGQALIQHIDKAAAS
ncbi:N-acetyl-L,L-diaminopimelate deacetylase (EC [Olavius algarvensis Delta 1 endosymbiont]|nr:N-acetyl-L,L-diaminopimelate deacetylase (EC [Olavius algarvensis Delta 1 endosymbiont]